MYRPPAFIGTISFFLALAQRQNYGSCIFLLAGPPPMGLFFQRPILTCTRDRALASCILVSPIWNCGMRVFSRFDFPTATPSCVTKTTGPLMNPATQPGE